MLRCTSAVPPPMVSAGENKKPRDQVVSPPAARAATATHRPRPIQHPERSGQVPGQVHDVLAVGVGDGLAHRRLGPRRPPGQDRRDHPQAQHPQDLRLDPHLHQPIPQAPGTAGSAAAPPRTNPTRSSAVGPIPHSAPSPDNDTRSLPKRDLGQRPPAVLRPDEWSAGMRTSVKNTSLKACSPVMSISGRISIPGASIGQTK